MALVACGINHQSAPLAVREKLAFHPDHIPQALHDLRQVPAVNEAVLLSTCNRTEIYAETDNPEGVLAWIADRPDTAPWRMNPYLYQHREFDMIRHVMRVASGLDSLVLGEAQIFGQMKQAYELACQTGCVGDHFKRLFPAVFATSKHIRRQTSIGSNSVTFAYAAVQLAKRIFSDMVKCSVLLIGTGEIIQLLLTHLHGQGIRRIIIANRTIEHAQQLAEPYQAQGIRIGEIPAHLKEIDMIFTATASQLPLLGKGAIETAIKQRKHRPMFIVDLAVPRDVEAEVGELEDVYLYNMDDLQAVISRNWKNREAAAKQAEAMVDMQAEHYLRQLRVIKVGDMIRRFRERMESLRDAEIEKATAHWERTKDPKATLNYLAHSLTKKILHQPTIKLREAAYEERLDLLLSAQDLFEL